MCLSVFSIHIYTSAGKQIRSLEDQQLQSISAGLILLRNTKHYLCVYSRSQCSVSSIWDLQAYLSGSRRLKSFVLLNVFQVCRLIMAEYLSWPCYLEAVKKIGKLYFFLSL